VTDSSAPIVVGVNGSAQALGAARWAGALAERLGAPLHLVMAVPTASHDPSTAHHAVGIDAAAMILSAAVEFVRDDHPGLVVTTASTSILAEETFAAASRTARLLVLGCDDVTAVGALLIGSTTLATVAQARCPVVAWRGSATEPNRKAIVVDFDGLPEDGGALGLAFALADRLEAPLQAVYCWPQYPLSRTLTGPIDIEWNAATQAQFAHLITFLRHGANAIRGSTPCWSAKRTSPATHCCCTPTLRNSSSSEADGTVRWTIRSSVRRP
jgi:nucleotide-binding universal stress UspA family protein